MARAPPRLRAVSGFVSAQAIIVTGFSLAFVLWSTPLLLRSVRAPA